MNKRNKKTLTKEAERDLRRELHNLYDKHDMRPIVTVFDNKQTGRAVFYACECGGALGYSDGVRFRAGRGQDLPCAGIAKNKHLHTDWDESVVKAISKNTLMREAWMRLPYVEVGNDYTGRDLSKIKRLEQKYGLR